MVNKKLVSTHILNKDVLLIESNKIAMFLHSILLKDINVNFDIANNGKEALQKFRENNYKLILLNINLPDIPGFHLSRSIRKEPQGQQVRIVTLTGYSSSIKQECLKGGIDAFYTKPISVKDFKDMILLNLNKAKNM